MKKILFIGENGSKKEELIQLLSQKPVRIKKNMAVEFYDNLINTPNEFLENKCFIKSLITASFDAEIILFVIFAKQKNTLLPPLFAPLFNKKVLGIITYIEENQDDFIRVTKFLNNSGIKNIYKIQLDTKEGLEELKKDVG